MVSCPAEAKQHCISNQSHHAHHITTWQILKKVVLFYLTHPIVTGRLWLKIIVLHSDTCHCTAHVCILSVSVKVLFSPHSTQILKTTNDKKKHTLFFRVPISVDGKNWTNHIMIYVHTSIIYKAELHGIVQNNLEEN